MTRKQHAKFHHITSCDFGVFALDEDGVVWEYTEEGDDERDEGWHRLSEERHED